MSLTMKSLVIGLATHVPGLRRIDGRATGGTTSARYCYATWMRCLSLLAENGHIGPFPTMVELGPGDSLGTGLAALLSGVSTHYIGLDAIPYASADRDAQVLEGLIDLFRARAAIPDDREFPGMFPRLASYAFPRAILPPDWEAALAEDRLRELRKAVRAGARFANPEARVRYIAPWSPARMPEGGVDLTMSQSVLQLIEDLPGLYRDMARWTKPGGLISHEIDFKSQGRTREWNGHWICSDAMWSFIQGRRTNCLNRAPYSRHVALMEGAGFRVFGDCRLTKVSKIDRGRLAPCFAGLDDRDLTTGSAVIQAVKVTRGQTPDR